MVSIWEAMTGKNLFTYRGYETPPRLLPVDATLQPLSGQIVAKDGQLYQYASSILCEINQVAWSPNGQWIASAGPNNTIRVWSAMI